MSSSSESVPQVQLPLPALTACGPGPDLAQRAQGLSQIMEEAGVMAQGDWEPAHVLDLPAPPAPAPWASDWPVLPALSQALRQGQLSPLELVRASLDRIQEDNPLINAFSLVWAEEALEQAARAEKRDPGRELARAPARGAVRGQGAVRHPGGAHHRRQPGLEGALSPGGGHLGEPAQGGRGHLAGPFAHARVRLWHHQPQSPLWAHPQSLGPGPHVRRVQQRLGRGGGGGHGAPGPGHRHRRLHPHSQFPVRGGRAQDHLWPGEPQGGGAPGLVFGHGGAHGHGPGSVGRRPGGHGRARSRGSGLLPGPGARLFGRAGRGGAWLGGACAWAGWRAFSPPRCGKIVAGQIDVPVRAAWSTWGPGWSPWSWKGWSRPTGRP